MRYYLTENGILYLETPNAYKRWTSFDPSQFCVDYKSYNDRLEPKFYRYIDSDSDNITESNAFFTTALLVSCVFLALTMIVYALLPDLRNLSGMVLMAYVASQFGAFLMLAVIQLDYYSVVACIALNISLNRGYAKARAIHRRGETFKFLIYCAYAWGLPLLMTIALVVLNVTDLSAYPWLITPNIPDQGCFLEGGQKLVYLYVPMLILITCNWIFFLMTAFNIWRLSRGTAVLNSASAGMPASQRFQRHRFLVYLKLSVIMGINWILEVISSFQPQLKVWYFTDAYNMLIGLAIFIIFVCKRKINVKLKKSAVGVQIESNYSGSIIVDDLKTCGKVKCINKCCNATDYIVGDKECGPYSGELSFDNVTVYTDDIYDTGKVMRDIFRLVPGMFSNVTFQSSAYEFTEFQLRNYLTEDGILYLETPNAFRRWTPLDRNHFCVDYQWLTSLDRVEPRFYLVLDDEYIPESNAFFTAALLISCVFLALTMIVYALLPDLRNLCGMVLMAYVASQFGAFLMLSVIQIGSHTVNACLGLTFCTYFFFLSSFCWMNVMSIDIWWTFRGYAKARAIHRRGETFKFLMYCIYAWGLPLLMTIALAVLNESDISAYPWLISPKIPIQGCFLEGGEKLLYLYVPMLILIICNWVFFLMTAFNIWRLSRGNAVLNSAAAGMPASHRFQRHRFLVYLKLSVIMGVNWILEVVSSLKPQLQIWYFTDAYNLLIGLTIFIIFVCKRKINVQLKRRLSDFRLSKMSNSSRSQSSVTTESNLSPDSTKVCSNPQYSFK
ncbi:unnamed protein product, partial [Iphiclides podalirius]